MQARLSCATLINTRFCPAATVPRPTGSRLCLADLLRAAPEMLIAVYLSSSGPSLRTERRCMNVGPTHISMLSHPKQGSPASVASTSQPSRLDNRHAHVFKDNNFGFVVEKQLLRGSVFTPLSCNFRIVSHAKATSSPNAHGRGLMQAAIIL